MSAWHGAWSGQAMVPVVAARYLQRPRSAPHARCISLVFAGWMDISMVPCRMGLSGRVYHCAMPLPDSISAAAAPISSQVGTLMRHPKRRRCRRRWRALPMNTTFAVALQQDPSTADTPAGCALRAPRWTRTRPSRCRWCWRRASSTRASVTSSARCSTPTPTASAASGAVIPVLSL